LIFITAIPLLLALTGAFELWTIVAMLPDSGERYMSVAGLWE